MQTNTGVTLTVIVPVYNVEKYLTQCLESIVRQSLLFDEVILINDGSTDKSLIICENYVEKYDYFKLINQKNKGQSAARNIGLREAVGEYILFLDSDDYLRADTVELLKDELRRFQQDAVYFDADIHCEFGYENIRNNYVRDLKDFVGVQMNGENFFLKSYPANYFVSPCLAVYKKETIVKLGILFPEGLYYEDDYFTFAFMIQAENVIYLPEKLYQRRYRENSTTTSGFTEKKFVDLINIILLLWEEVYKWKDLTLPENQTYLKFISDYCKTGLERRHLCKKNNIKLHDNSQKVIDTMVKKYEFFIGQYFLDDSMGFNLLNSILKTLKKMMLCQEYKETAEQLLNKVKGLTTCLRAESAMKQFYKKLLCGLPLNTKDCKVGIYGVGEHTEGLLAIYEECIGKVSCNLFFIDSYRESGCYLGRDIINYRQIDDSCDLIIISSFLYRWEMIENIQSVNKKVPIYNFYDDLKEDVFSGWDLW